MKTSTVLNQYANNVLLIVPKIKGKIIWLFKSGYRSNQFL